MQRLQSLVSNTLTGGLLVLLPIYLAILLLVQGMRAVGGLVAPFAGLLPASIPAAEVLSLLLVVLVCAAVGAAVRTSPGRAVRDRIERAFFARLPGYALFRSLTQRLAGENQDSVWKPALVEIEDALVPAFVVEEHDDGRYTVFVPSVPTPLAGAVYVLSHDRVHPIDVPFAQAVRTVSQWGSGSKELVAAMRAQAAQP